MRIVYPIILIYCLIALAGTLKGFSILNNSDARLSAALADAGISSTTADYIQAKGCAK